MPSTVKIRLVAARNLPVMNHSSNLTDAFAEVRFGNQFVYQTGVVRKNLNPRWNHDVRFEVVDDSMLQDEPLVCRVLDRDAYLADNLIGTAYLGLDPSQRLDALKSGASPTARESSDSAHKDGHREERQYDGWLPLYDTLNGLQGELYITVKVSFYGDENPFTDSSAGVQYFSTSHLHALSLSVSSVLGFVEELQVASDPEYDWSDSFRSARKSNEARQLLLYRLASTVRRQVGKKVLALGGNAVIGYRQIFDLEGDSGIVCRISGTACIIISTLADNEDRNPLLISRIYFDTGANNLPEKSGNERTRLPSDNRARVSKIEPRCTSRGMGTILDPKNKSTAPARFWSAAYNGGIGFAQFSPITYFHNLNIPARIADRLLLNSDMICEDDMNNDLVMATGDRLRDKDNRPGWDNSLNRSARKSSFINVSPGMRNEVTLFTITVFPANIRLQLGGIVAARSVKYLGQLAAKIADQETRDQWWNELRDEIRSHARALHCHNVIGYAEECVVFNDICVLQATGTAAILKADRPIWLVADKSNLSTLDPDLLFLKEANKSSSSDKKKRSESLTLCGGYEDFIVPLVGSDEGLYSDEKNGEGIPVRDSESALRAQEQKSFSNDLVVVEIPSEKRIPDQRITSNRFASKRSFDDVQGSGQTNPFHPGRNTRTQLASSIESDSSFCAEYSHADGGNAARKNLSSTKPIFPCHILHAPYRQNKAPFSNMRLVPCGLCKKKLVPEIVLSTIEPPSLLPIAGRGMLVEARICRWSSTKPTSKAENRESEATALGESLVFLEIELHKQFASKMKLLGMNAAFSIRSQIELGANLVIGIISGTAVHSPALPPPALLRVHRSIAVVDQEDRDLIGLQKRIESVAAGNRESMRSDANESIGRFRETIRAARTAVKRANADILRMRKFKRGEGYIAEATKEEVVEADILPSTNSLNKRLGDEPVDSGTEVVDNVPHDKRVNSTKCDEVKVDKISSNNEQHRSSSMFLRFTKTLRPSRTDLSEIEGDQESGGDHEVNSLDCGSAEDAVNNDAVTPSDECGSYDPGNEALSVSSNIEKESNMVDPTDEPSVWQRLRAKAKDMNKKNRQKRGGNRHLKNGKASLETTAVDPPVNLLNKKTLMINELHPPVPGSSANISASAVATDIANSSAETKHEGLTPFIRSVGKKEKPMHPHVLSDFQPEGLQPLCESEGVISEGKSNLRRSSGLGFISKFRRNHMPKTSLPNAIDNETANDVYLGDDESESTKPQVGPVANLAATRASSSGDILKSFDILRRRSKNLRGLQPMDTLDSAQTKWNPVTPGSYSSDFPGQYAIEDHFEDEDLDCKSKRDFSIEKEKSTRRSGSELHTRFQEADEAYDSSSSSSSSSLSSSLSMTDSEDQELSENAEKVDDMVPHLRSRANFVIDVDDETDEDIMSVLLDRQLPAGVIICNSEVLPESTLHQRTQLEPGHVVTVMMRKRLDSTRSTRLNLQLAEAFHELNAMLCLKLVRFAPCVASGYNVNLSIPSAFQVEIFITVMVNRMLAYRNERAIEPLSATVSRDLTTNSLIPGVLPSVLESAVLSSLPLVHSSTTMHLQERSDLNVLVAASGIGLRPSVGAHNLVGVASILSKSNSDESSSPASVNMVDLEIIGKEFPKLASFVGKVASKIRTSSEDTSLSLGSEGMEAASDFDMGLRLISQHTQNRPDVGFGSYNADLAITRKALPGKSLLRLYPSNLRKKIHLPSLSFRWPSFAAANAGNESLNFGKEKRTGQSNVDQERLTQGNLAIDDFNKTLPLENKLSSVVWKPAVEITPLSYLPNQKVLRYLGALNLHFIRESWAVREDGKLGNYFNVFLSEVQTIVRAHVAALGGNALLSFRLIPRESSGKALKSVYNMVSVSGDVVLLKPVPIRNEVRRGMHLSSEKSN